MGRTLKPIGGVRPRPLFSADAFPTSSANAATPRIVSIIIRGPARDCRGRHIRSIDIYTWKFRSPSAGFRHHNAIL